MEAYRQIIYDDKKIIDIKDINRKTLEGRLLWAALIKLTTESQTDKTPYEVLEQLNKLELKIEFDEST